MATTAVPPAQRWWAMAGIGLGVLMSTLDGSIVNIALPTLVEQLNTSFATVQWVVLSYLLVITVSILNVGRLGDQFGKKPLYQLGLVVFSLGSLLCGLAPDAGWLIAFRALQGLGAVMVSALGAAIVAEIFPPAERGRALGIIGSFVSVGIALGPSIGGLLIGLSGWRSIFLVNVPLGALAVALVARAVPDLPASRSGRGFDLPGTLLLVGTLVCYTLGITFLADGGLPGQAIAALLAGALAGLALFLLAEARVRQPMLDLRMFRSGAFSLNLAMGVLVFVATMGNLLILPFFLERVKGFSTLQTGLLLAVVPLVTAAIAPLAGALSDRYGTRPITLLGLLLMVVGYLLAGTLDADVGVAGYLLRVALSSIGFGFFQSPNNSAIMNSAPPEQLGVASGLLSLSRTLGQTSGVAAMGALFAGLTAAAGGGVGVAAATPAAILQGVQGTFHVAAAVALATLLLASFGTWRYGGTAEMHNAKFKS